MRLLSARFVLVASAAIVAASAETFGVPAPRLQAPQKPTEVAQPSFRSGTELVVVDVAVVGKDGEPVKGLQAEDFTVKIDGEPRRIASMQYVDQATGAPPAAPEGPAVRYTSNESAGAGRLIVILVDESSIHFGGFRAAAESIDRLLAGFGPTDRITLAALPGPRTLVEFTTDRAKIARATRALMGGAALDETHSQYYVSVDEAFAFDRNDATVIAEVSARECAAGPTFDGCSQSVQVEAKRIALTERDRTTQFAAGLRTLLSALRAIDAPKLLIVFSEGFAAPDATDTFLPFGHDATEARTVIYAMRLDRSMFDISHSKPIPLRDQYNERRTAIIGLDALAGVGRGMAFNVIGPADAPFKRLAAEVSGYYLVGVEPEGNDRDGRLHQIRVDVGRPGVTVRSRREFTYRRAVTDDAKMFASAIALPLPTADLPLRVGTFSMPNEDPSKVFVLTVAEIGRAAFNEGSAIVGFVLTNEQGKPVLTARERMTLPATAAGTLLFTGKFAVPAGTYAMKFAAVYDGKAGSVEHHVIASLTPPEAARARPTGSTPQIGDLIVMPPTAIRGTFAPSLDGRIRGDEVVGLVQVGIDRRTKEDRTFLFEVVKEEQGPALASAPGSPDPAMKGRCRTIEAAVDARLLPPGEYWLRLTASRQGTPQTTLLSPFSLVRLAPSERATAAAKSTTAPLPGAAKFQPQDVLEASVVGPFLDEVAKLSPEGSRPALEQAKSGQFDEALRQLKGGGRNDPSAPFIRGLSLFAKGQYQLASNAFREAIAAAPQLLVGAFYIGACYAAGGLDARAINAWQTSLISLEEYPATYRVLADALMRAGQPERARVFIEEAAQKWPEDETVRAQALQANLEAGRYEQVLEYADQILARQPSDTAAPFLAMRSIFQAVLDRKEARVDELLPRFERYYGLYAAAGGPQQPLAAAWLSFLRTR
jgi:VWFA-related protein